MRFYSLEYNNKTLINLNDNPSLMLEVLSFKREAFLVSVDSIKHYHEINNSTEVLKLLNDNKVVAVIHQDSERDVFILLE